MKKPLSVAPFVLLLCSSWACRQQASPPAKAGESQAGRSAQADVAAIKALEEEWVRLYNACDFDKLMAVFYTEDIVLMAPNVPAATGKDAVLRGYRKDDETNIEHVDTSVVEDVRISGDLAVARGRDTGTTMARKGGKPVPYDLKWVMAFGRQADRTWKCFAEIWCENPLPKGPD
jgi:ketosteroid isomerase-like protein